MISGLDTNDCIPFAIGTLRPYDAYTSLKPGSSLLRLCCIALLSLDDLTELLFFPAPRLSSQRYWLSSDTTLFTFFFSQDAGIHSQSRLSGRALQP